MKTYQSWAFCLRKCLKIEAERCFLPPHSPDSWQFVGCFYGTSEGLLHFEVLLRWASPWFGNRLVKMLEV